MIKNYQKSLSRFLKQAELISNKKTNKKSFILEYFRLNNGWGSSYKMIDDRRSLYTDIDLEKKISSLPEIQETLKNIYKILSYTGENNEEKNKIFDKRILFDLFLRYKELNERNAIITYENFSSYKAKKLISKEKTVHYRAPLIGLNLKGVDSVKINDFEIRKLSDSEKLEMMNNYQEGDPLSIVRPNFKQKRSEFWIIGKVNFKHAQKFRTAGFVLNDTQLIIEDEINTILSLFRLYKSIEIGINIFYIKNSYTDNDGIFQKWNSEVYKFGDFGRLKRKEDGWGKGWFLNFQSEIIDDDIIGLQEAYKLIEKFKKNPIEQISQALMKFSNAFEHNNVIYVFTDLMVSLESLLNNPKKVFELTKEKIIKNLEETKNKIEETEDIEKIYSHLSNLNPYRGISKSLTIILFIQIK